MGTGSSIIAMLGGAMGRHTQLADEKRKEEAANRQMLVDATLNYGSKNWDIMGPEERTRFLTGAAQIAGVKDPNLFNALLGMHDQMYKVIEHKMHPVEKQIPQVAQPVAPPMQGATPMPQTALAPPPPLPTTAMVPEFGPVSTSYPTAIEARLAVQQQAEEQDIQRQIAAAKASGVPEEDLRDLELSLRSKGRLIPLMGQRVSAQSREEIARINQGNVVGKPVPWNVFDSNTGKYRVANVITAKGGASYEVDAEGRRIPFLAGPFDRPFKDQGVGTFITPDNKVRFVDKTTVFPGVTSQGTQAVVTEPMFDVRAGGTSGAGAALLTPDQVNEVALAIKEGRRPPNLKGLYRNGAAVAAALAADHGYNVAQAELDWNAVNKNIVSRNATQQLRLMQAINTAPELVKSAEQIFNRLQELAPGYNYRLLNRLDLAAIKQIPGEPGILATKLETQIADLTADMASIYMGGNTPTDHALELGAKNLSMNWSVDQFRAALNLLRTNIEIRRNSVLTAQPAGVRPGSPYMAGRGGTAEPSSTPDSDKFHGTAESDRARKLREKYLPGR